MNNAGVARPCESWSDYEAWTAEQVVESLARGDFYTLCPDNDVTREMDQKRMAWAMGDLIENRHALSRWHPDSRRPDLDSLGKTGEVT